MRKSGKEHIVFPLDVSSGEEAMRYVKLLSGSVGMFKIGLELFFRCGPDIVRRVRDESNTGIFLDLKLHDIPNTVYHAMKSVKDLGVSLVTVHCGENRKMLEAAVEAGEGRAGVLGVTVLTSVSGGDVRAAGFREEYTDLMKLVLARARDANSAGCAGVVCSGRETRMIKTEFGSDFLAVTPGIRPLWNLSEDDQKRVVTPSAAVKDGADYLVIGRPIRTADDPAEAAARIAAEIDSAVSF